VVLAQDETDLLLFPPLRSCWSPVGQPKVVLLSGRNARRVVFGAMNLRTGSRFTLVRERQRAVDFQEFLKVLHNSYRGWHVAMLLDEDPSHTAKGSVRLAERFAVELLWLPKRMPELNPMDTLWGQAKDVVCADKQYPSLDEQVQRFIRHLESLSPQVPCIPPVSSPMTSGYGTSCETTFAYLLRDGQQCRPKKQGVA
jgi:DDE superfamily endonuclease